MGRRDARGDGPSGEPSARPHHADPRPGGRRGSGAFDAARTANPALQQWSAIDAFAAASLGGWGTAAIGGDLAYRYGHAALGKVGVATALATVADPRFATAPQSLGALDDLARDAVKLGA